ncbi:MAG: hypothetical protein ACK5N8_08780 [Alphaproteobacteria bacterium]
MIIKNFYNGEIENPELWERMDIYIDYLLKNHDAYFNNDGCLKCYRTDFNEERLYIPDNISLKDINFPSGVSICSLKNSQIQKFCIELQKKFDCFTEIQTSNEFIYNLDEILKKNIYKIRRASRELLENNVMHFENINIKNKNDAISVIKSWSRIRTHKFPEGITENKDIFYINACLSSSDNVVGLIGYIDEKPISTVVAGISGKTGTIAVAKALSGYQFNNEVFGVKGATEASYLAMANLLYNKQLNWMNDGDSPIGSGGERRKASWNPSHLINSYKIKLRQK